MITGQPNVTICHETSFKNRSVTLIGMVFVPEQRPEIETLFWSKNGQKLNSQGIKGKYSEVSINDPSLTIFEVNQHDAGSYQLTATNALGSTQSEAIVLGIFNTVSYVNQPGIWSITLQNNRLNHETCFKHLFFHLRVI